LATTKRNYNEDFGVWVAVTEEGVEEASNNKKKLQLLTPHTYILEVNK
jgi:hypothetical protein